MLLQQHLEVVEMHPNVITIEVLLITHFVDQVNDIHKRLHPPQMHIRAAHPNQEMSYLVTVVVALEAISPRTTHMPHCVGKNGPKNTQIEEIAEITLDEIMESIALEEIIQA